MAGIELALSSACVPIFSQGGIALVILMTILMAAVFLRRF
jgi:hypothetical protein